MKEFKYIWKSLKYIKINYLLKFIYIKIINNNTKVKNQLSIYILNLIKLFYNIIIY